MKKRNNLENWIIQIIKYLNKKYKIKKNTISGIIIDWEDKKENLLENNIKMIKLFLPVRKIILNSQCYKLIIIDNKGIYYCFTEDGYDGYSCDTIIPTEDNPN